MLAWTALHRHPWQAPARAGPSSEASIQASSAYLSARSGARRAMPLAAHDERMPTLLPVNSTLNCVRTLRDQTQAHCKIKSELLCNVWRLTLRASISQASDSTGLEAMWCQHAVAHGVSTRSIGRTTSGLLMVLTSARGCRVTRSMYAFGIESCVTPGLHMAPHHARARA